MKILNQLRIEAGYSISDLARMMDVTDEVICRWLCGSACPTLEQTDRLADIFAVETQSLLPCPSKNPARSDKLRAKFTTASRRVRSGDSTNWRRARSG